MRREKLLSFIQNYRYAIQASVSPSGAPQAAVVGIAVTDSLEIVFDSVDTSRKSHNLRSSPMVAFVIGGYAPGDEKTVQYEGIADLPQGSDLERCKETYYRRFPDGQQRLNWPGIAYLRVRPTWVRFSDFSTDPPRIVEFSAESLAGV